MEDASNEVNTTVMPIPLKSVEVDVSEEPKLDSDREDSKVVKVNGDTKVENSDGTESSDYDNLVIDERPKNNRKRKQLPFSPESGFKGFKRIKNEEDYEPPTNPYFNESLFELSELHNNKNIHSLEKSANSEEKTNSNTTTTSNLVHEIGTNSSTVPTPTQLKKLFGKKKKAGSPKLREYAQYLGLQPTVQFKCSRCALRGFSSLALLNEHQLDCTGEGPTSPPASTQTTAPSTNFRVTRKVYLCSACGTYYENWNLFLHMREIHKRFICLYCLGMFSQPEKLSLHLVSKHNCVPSQLNSEEDFFHVYKEPCFLMCCECEKVFSERDNFFGHTCCGKANKSGTETKNKNNANNTNGNNHRQLVNQKNNKNSKQAKNNKTFIEHVTGDTAVESKDEAMTEENEEMNCKEAEVDKEEETQTVVEKEDPEECNDVGEDQLQEQLSKDCDVLEANEDNQEADVELSKDESFDKSDCELKARESESEAEDILESPRYVSESPLNQEEDDPEEINEEPIDENDATRSESEQGDTRKVPKVTLKLPKNTTPYVDNQDSDDSDKLMMELDSVDGEVNVDINVNDEKENKDPLINVEPTLDVAGSEIPIVELELEHPLDKFDIQILLQKCLKETIPTCVYCNHARKIAVNGKQLGLHAIAEHRFSAIVNSITAEELIPESFVMRIKESLPELQNVYFNLESSAPEEGVTFSHIFECFQCRYATTIHKELYLHNRKMHAKTILLCIMCKSNFYSYSELICHLCPGLYELNNDVNFRCCMCVCDDLPSAFRLMVHLRKRHHACDVCLELCHNQSRLSNHVWKHKLHHLCYRCGIAYRNKPDITKHLFWKHGTESVLCKKCLQKKWPHVYHFCIPPSTFTCEECNLNFTKAVALKVHKRIHRFEKPHCCTFENCNEKFISKKLLLKHEFKHREPPEDAREKDLQNKVQEIEDTCTENGDEKPEDPVKDENSNEATEKKSKPRVDVYDLPELNLSESDSSDSEEESPKFEKEVLTEDVPKLEADEEASKPVENESEQRTSDDSTVVGAEPSVPVLENIWDDFKLYQASKGKLDNTSKSEADTENEFLNTTLNDFDEKPEIKQEEMVDIIMRDHDYSLLSQEYKTEPQQQQTSEGTSLDHDYCSSNVKIDSKEEPEVNDDSALKPVPSPEKKEVKASSTSDSSNDSDSSSCTCGSNCSCSGSSDSSSSSSDSSDSDSSSSEGRRKQQARREKRKRAKSNKKEIETPPIDVVTTDNPVAGQVEQHIEESDLDTTETETDEDFYDKQPQKLASKLIAEKRKELMLLAGIGTLANGAVLESSRPSTPSLPETETLKVKKKSKNKKKKKKRKQEKQALTIDIPSTSYKYQQQVPIVSPLTISLTKNSPLGSPNHTSLIGSGSLEEQMLGSNSDFMNMSDPSLRASKRRRIPNKFYGYSSDEEGDRPHPPVLKWRKADLPSPARPTPNSPMVVPPITIKALPPPVPVPEEPTVPNRSLNLNEMRARQQTAFVQPNFQHNARPLEDSASESNESSSEEEQPQPPPLLNKPPNQPPLYCYCRCPYDEVSEMIGCDADDCLIEWFHFECVGIMVPPKGQWFCPDCRKKKQQRKELALT